MKIPRKGDHKKKKMNELEFRAYIGLPPRNRKEKKIAKKKEVKNDKIKH